MLNLSQAAQCSTLVTMTSKVDEKIGILTPCRSEIPKKPLNHKL